MILNLYTSFASKFPVVRSLNYRLQSLTGAFGSKNMFGVCSLCGNYSRFKYYQLLDANSKVVQSCGFDEQFTAEMNLTNTLDCGYCGAKFRVRCAAQSLLKHFGKGKIKSISELVEKFNSGEMDLKILETARQGGVFSGYELKQVVKSEYFDDVPRGEFKGGVRSEDLQALTFGDDSLDAVISLDVFEHIADPWLAFKEIHRVLKAGGIGVVTVPIDFRIKTTTAIAKIENHNVVYIRKPAYHLDPLREEGALVFTEFGMDIEKKLKDMGFAAKIDAYKAHNASQFVILITK